MPFAAKAIVPQNSKIDKVAPLWKGGFCIPTPINDGGDMREVSGHFLYDLGSIWVLAKLPAGPVTVETYQSIVHCINLLKGFSSDKNNIQDLPDAVSQANYVASKLDELGKKILDHVSQQKIPEITEEWRNIIIVDISQFRTLLFSELNKLSVIVLEEKRGYSVDALWKHPWKLIDSDVSNHLSEFVKENLKEASKCLVLDCYTAVGFHSTRSVECVARKYYKLIIDNPQGRRFKTLGIIAKELTEKLEKLQTETTPCGDLPIIAPMLKGLCKIYRDPLAHPEIITLQPNDAIEVLIDTIQIISRVVKDSQIRGAHFATPWAGDPF